MVKDPVGVGIAAACLWLSLLVLITPGALVGHLIGWFLGPAAGWTVGTLITAAFVRALWKYQP